MLTEINNPDLAKFWKDYFRNAAGTTFKVLHRKFTVLDSDGCYRLMEGDSLLAATYTKDQLTLYIFKKGRLV